MTGPCAECGQPLDHLPRDPDLAHQMRTGNQGWRLYVSCNCRRIAGDTYEPLEIRSEREPFPVADMIATYLAHLVRAGAI